MTASMPLTLAEMLYEELEQLDPDPAQESLKGLKARIDELQAKPTWDDRQELSKSLVKEIYKHIHKQAKEDPTKRRAALCLSGGGVRSATFNLGILQGLARAGLLEKFDYLATVSGGGFIGGWLTAWIHRTDGGVTEVAKQMSDRAKDPLKPEPEPLYKLRIYSNYLTPRKGLLSVDTWTLMAVYLRNLLLNWLVFLPVIVAFLMLPRIWVAIFRSSHLSAHFCLYVGLFSGFLALIYIALNLPAIGSKNWKTVQFVVWCLAPLVISAMALSAYWVRLPSPSTRNEFVLFSVGLVAIPWIAFLIIKPLLSGKKESKTSAAKDPSSSTKESPSNANDKPSSTWISIRNYVVATFLIFAALALTGLVTWFVVTQHLPLPPTFKTSYVRLYATFAVPALLLLMTFGATLIAGFTSRFTEVEDQEWWARSGGWILIFAAAWILFHVLVLFGPILFVNLQTELINRKNWSFKALTDLKATITTVIGLIAGAITLVGGFSAKTAANGKDSDSGLQGKVTMTVAGIAFAAFMIIVLALVSDWILASDFGAWMHTTLLGGQAPDLSASDLRTIVYETPGRVLVVLAVAVAVVGGILGRFINTNRFSLHYYYRNRVMRAYLGASRERSNERNKFTGFDCDDNIQMHELKQKPLHVVNITLNLVGGDKLQWQDRKAESFSVSPLHTGSYWLGYRNSKLYGGPAGISLANAVAISGAAASPNMGYMMTSPIVRFLMTLFNVRLGFWLGNPGPAGSGDDWATLKKATFNRDSPTQSVRPILCEALGLTNSKSPYVYLSDGGHFENFGLYEMILRRCKFIVIGDGSTDPGYSLDCLAQSIRQIRVDFGVPIEMEAINVGNDPAKKNKYCAIGKVRYSCVDRPPDDKNKVIKDETNTDEYYDGVLVYLKPSLNGTEPRDVLNYRNSYPSFPEDSIADQWFSEAQFESYRMLGSHMIEQITKTSASAADLFDRFEQQVRAQGS
jgi:hypothetical protein